MLLTSRSLPDAELVFSFFAHHVWTPGWTPNQFHIGFADVREILEGVVNFLHDHRTQRATEGCERHCDQHIAGFFDIRVVHKAQVDDVDSDFRVIHVLQAFVDIVFGERCHVITPVSTSILTSGTRPNAYVTSVQVLEKYQRCPANEWRCDYRELQ